MQRMHNQLDSEDWKLIDVIQILSLLAKNRTFYFLNP